MSDCKPDYSLLSLVIISQTVYFLDLDKEIVDGLKDTEFEWILRHRAWCRRYASLRYMPEGKKSLIEAIDKDPVFEMAKNQGDISFLLLVLELTRIWIETVPNHLPPFEVSKKKLRLGFRGFAKSMLRLKFTDKAKYKDKKEIIENSRTAAKHVWGAINRHILCAEHPYKGV